MALFDFDALKDRARDLAQTGVSKSKQIGEIAKLNLANVGEEENIRKAYIEIGKLYYAERGMAPEPAYAALCEKITASKVTIEENKNRVEELKAEGGVQDSEVEFPVETLAETPAKEAPVAPEENKDVPPAE
ncbi:MAG: serine proteinase [Oscillospiraceae bacterium]|nr:serine proteinase [Oscillospiraceae bacterium]